MTFKQTALFMLGILLGTLAVFIWMLSWDWRDSMTLIAYMVAGFGATALLAYWHDECKKGAIAAFSMGCAAGVLSSSCMLLAVSANLMWAAWYEKGSEWLR